MTTDQMREKITDAYPSLGWKDRVARMKDNQVAAIYRNCEKRGMFEKHSNGRRCKQITVFDILKNRRPSCDYYIPSLMDDLLAYCKKLYDNPNWGEKGHLFRVLSEHDYTDETLLGCLENVIRYDTGDEYELGVMICSEYLKLSPTERVIFDWCWHSCDYNCKNDCKNCKLLEQIHVEVNN